MVATIAGPTAYSVDPVKGGHMAVLKHVLPVLAVVVEVISADEVHVTATAFTETFLDERVKTDKPVALSKMPLKKPRGASIEAQLKLLKVHEHADQALWGSFCITLPSKRQQRWDGQLVSFPAPSTPALSGASSQSVSSDGSQAGLPRSTAPSSFVIGAGIEKTAGGAPDAAAAPKCNWGSHVIDLTKAAPAAPAAAATKRSFLWWLPAIRTSTTTSTFKVTNQTHQSINLQAKLIGQYQIPGQTIPPGQIIPPGHSIPPGTPEGFKSPTGVSLTLQATAGLGRAAAPLPVARPGTDWKVVQGLQGLQLKAVKPPRKTWMDLVLAVVGYFYDAAMEDTRAYRDLPLTCSVFVRDSATLGEFVYPELSDGKFGLQELQDKKSFGVCVSGGGTRAAISSLGVVRGLHHMGVLAKARYLCSTSGGSWFNSAFSFVPVTNTRSLEDFLGQHIEPSGLTPTVLKKIGAQGISFASTVQDRGNLIGLLGDVGASLVGNKWFSADESGAWANWVTNSFLAPFGLGELRYSTVTARGTKGEVHEATLDIAKGWANGISKKFDVYEYDSLNGQRPFPILMQTVLLPRDTRVFYSKEWTPLYAGVPADLVDTNDQHVGGGYVETIGVNSKVDQHAPSTGTDRVNLRSMGPGSLGGAAGISSSFIPFLTGFGVTLTGVLVHLALGGILQWFWSPAHLQDEPFLTQMADGAGTDNPAITPLLRREVKKIICWTHTDCDPTDYNSFAANSTVAQFFGAYPGRRFLGGFTDYLNVVSYLTDHPRPAAQNKLRQVFLKKDYDKLWEHVSDSYAKGGPVYHRAKLQVQANEFEAIAGGWVVEVLFVFNCTCKNFEAQLPKETKDLLNKQKRSMLLDLKLYLEALPEASWLVDIPVVQMLVYLVIRLVTLVLVVLDWIRGQIYHFLVWPANLGDFPLVPTQFLNYTPELVNMLSSQSAWATVQLKKEIDEMLKEVKEA